MKNKINILLIILYGLVLINLSGCWGARELRDLAMVVGMGVDKGTAPGSFIFTAQIVKPSEIGVASAKSGGGESKAFWNAKSTGATVFEAVRNITHKTGNRLFVSHSQAVIFGSDIAKEGLHKYIDFFLRAHEMRPTSIICIAKDNAGEVLDIEPETEKLPVINIVKLVKSYGFTSQSLEVNLQDFASRLLSKTTAPMAPLVDISHFGGEKNVYLAGLAVFKHDKMIGTLNKKETRGLLWVTGQVKSGVIDVNIPGGKGKAALEILKAKSKVTPEIRDGKIYMHISIKETASLAEQSTTENLATVPQFAFLEKKQSEIIRQEVMAAFNKSKKLNTDVFGFGDIVHKKYRSEWKQLETDWDNIYPSIELIIKVETIIVKSDLITKPAVPAKD